MGRSVLRRRCSFATNDVDADRAALWCVWIIVAADYLVSGDGDHVGHFGEAGDAAAHAQSNAQHPGNPGSVLDRRLDRAALQGLTEGEIIGPEKAARLS